jgi:hypothetical protein
MYTLSDGQGTLFPDKKATPSAPDYTGKFILQGQTFRIAGWNRSSTKTGQPFLSLKVEPLAPAGATGTNPGHTAITTPAVPVDVEPGMGETAWELTPRGPEHMVLPEGVSPPSRDWRFDPWYHDSAERAKLVKEHPHLSNYK